LTLDNVWQVDELGGIGLSLELKRRSPCIWTLGDPHIDWKHT
jgi:hypothetical protein